MQDLLNEWLTHADLQGSLLHVDAILHQTHAEPTGGRPATSSAPIRMTRQTDPRFCKQRASFQPYDPTDKEKRSKESSRPIAPAAPNSGEPIERRDLCAAHRPRSSQWAQISIPISDSTP
jgi:hypothetical protein